jgi:hypothetical protein
LWGGIVTQVLLEVLFVIGALWVAKAHHLLPRVPWQKVGMRILGLAGICFVAKAAMYLLPNDNGTHIVWGVCLNGVIALLYWKDMKSIAKEFSV